MPLPEASKSSFAPGALAGVAVERVIDRIQQGTGGVAVVLPEHDSVQPHALDISAFQSERFRILVGDELLFFRVVEIWHRGRRIPVARETLSQQGTNNVPIAHEGVWYRRSRLEQTMVGRRHVSPDVSIEGHAEND